MKKLKLKPSARDKRRYFVILSDDKKKIETSLLNYLGILGMAKAKFMFVKKLPKGKIIGSCERSELNDVRAGLTLSGFSISKVSGTLKGLGN